jgi:sRNA-binding protein
MVDNLNLSTLISQIPEAQKLHHSQVAHPEVQQALAQEMVMRRQRQEQKQVSKADASATENQVDPEGRGEAPKEYFMGERKRPNREAELESDQGRLIDTQV